MAKFTPLSRSKHARKTWTFPTHFGFASRATYVEVLGGEAGAVAAEMPLTFVRKGNRFVLVGLVSCHGNCNVFVAPDGRWLGSYVPAAFRYGAFRLMHDTSINKVVLCIDEENPQFADREGQRLFDDNGEPSKLAKEIINTLEQLRKTQAAITTAAHDLQEAGVIVSWQAEIYRNGTVFDQLHRIDELLLQKLDDDSFLKLRKAGALALAYTQIVSMGRVSFLRQLTAAQQRYALVRSSSTTLSDVLGVGNNDSLDFDR